jgi:hypothetical protein
MEDTTMAKPQSPERSSTVDTVDSMDLTGAKVMVGTYPVGSQRVAISPTTLPSNNYGLEPSKEAGYLLHGDELPISEVPVDAVEIPDRA